MNRELKDEHLETQEVTFTGVYYTSSTGDKKFHITGVVDPNNLKRAHERSDVKPRFKLVPFIKEKINELDNQLNLGLINLKTPKNVEHVRYFCDKEGKVYFYSTDGDVYYLSADGQSCVDEYGGFYEIEANHDLIPVAYPKNGFEYRYVSDRAMTRASENSEFEEEDLSYFEKISSNPFEEPLNSKLNPRIDSGSKIINVDFHQGPSRK